MKSNLNVYGGEAHDVFQYVQSRLKVLLGSLDDGVYYPEPHISYENL